MAEWRDFLESRFPGYLLPKGAGDQLSVEAAQSFLRRVTRRPGTLENLRRLALIQTSHAAIIRFVEQELPALVRVLPSRTEVVRRRWEGGFRGRLAVIPTVRERLQARPATFITQDRRRTFDLPENRLVRAVSGALLDVIQELAATDFAHGADEFRRVAALHGSLQRTVLGTVLSQVPERTVTPECLSAARMARHQTFEAAAALHSEIDRALYSRNEEQVARLIAKGALLPTDDATRFELAVLVRVIEALSAVYRASDSAWDLQISTIDPKRRDVARLVHPTGNEIRVHYDQAVLAPGLRDITARHYFINAGRLRPDVTVQWIAGEQVVDACVFEVKLTEDASYVARGLGEAMLYAHEYRSDFSSTPHSVLVSSASVEGKPRQHDRVVALDWTAVDGGVLEDIIFIHKGQLG